MGVLDMRTGGGLTHWHVPLLLALVLAAGGEVVLTLRETPRGSIHGVVLAEETGVPIAGARVVLRGDFKIDGKRPRPIRLTTDEDGEFGVSRIPAGEYEVQARGEAHELPPMRVTVEEGRTRELALELAPQPSWLNVYVHQHVFAPDEQAEVDCHGFLQDDEIVVRRWRVDYAKLMLDGGGYLYGLVAEAESRYLAGLSASPHFTDIGEVRVPITAREAEGIFRQRIAVPLPGPGLYVVTVQGDGLRERDWLMVTDLGLITKKVGDQLLAYAVEVLSGQPVSDVTVNVHGGRRVIASAKTNGDGLARLTMRPRRGDGHVVIMARRGDSLAAIETYHWPSDARPHRVYVYTDRPVYRPGQMVRFKGVFRQIGGDSYEVPQPQKVAVEVRDDLDTLMHKTELQSSERGSFADAFRLPPTASTGEYRLTTTVDGRHYSSSFTVAAYRKPEYSVTVRPEEPRYVRGDAAAVTVESRYYFGMPVADAEVEYYVYRAPYWFAPSEDEELQTYEYDQYGELVASGTARTDERGIARLTVETKMDDEEALDSDHRFRVEVTVTDPSRREVTESGTFLVTRGEFVLVVQPDRYTCMPGEAVTLGLRAIDYDDRPRAGVEIAVSAGSEEWIDNEVRYEEELAQRVTTDDRGRASVTFSPKAEGRYRISAKAKDPRGNRIAASTDLWVTGRTYASLAYKYPDLEIITDKRTFEVGETVTALINTKASGAMALVTIEGEKLHEWHIVPLRGNSTTVSVPIRTEYIPNVYLSVCYVKNKKFASASKPLRVSSRSRSLVVDVTPDKSVYRPRETATYRIKTTRPDGRAVSAEVSLGVVDESIYAIREERGPDILPFFYAKRGNAVGTSYSFPRIYLGDADKAGAAEAVRKLFPDTAFWEPAIITNEQGLAEVKFEVPDTLTTWRATARGHTLDTAVGSVVAKVRCTKDFLVRLQAPRFLIQRDEVTISAITHNDTPRAQQVTLHLQGQGLRGAPTAPPVSVQPQKVHRRDWPLLASALGPLPLTVTATAATGLQDAMQLTIPVIPHGRERVEWRNGTLSSSVAEKLRVRDDAVGGASTVRIMLTPSIASCMLGSLEYLTSYPYGCTEQTMSSFLPDVVVARALRELRLEQPSLEKRLPDMVRAGLLKLYGHQHDDGGWGWCRYDDSDPWMTGYVVFGLLQAKAAGFSVNERVVRQGLRALKRLAQQRGLSRTTRAYLCYVLAAAGPQHAQKKLLADLLRDLRQHDPQSLAYVVLSCLYVGDRANAERAMIALWRRRTEDASFCYWGSPRRWGGAVTGTEVTALALKAAVYLQSTARRGRGGRRHPPGEVTPRDAQVLKIVRWLVLNRRGNHWYSTRDTAMILYALADFLKHSRELEPDYDVSIMLNDRPLGEPIHFDKSSIFSPQIELSAGKELRTGDNILRLEKQGPGSLYYTVRFGQYVGAEDLPMRVGGSGIVIERNYYKLSLGRDDVSGQLRLLPSKSPRQRFRSGDLIRARVSMRSARDYDYMMIEDPIPAGCEVIERGDMPQWEWGFWWDDVDVRDQMVSFFARRLPQGRRTIEYILRAQIPGKFHVMPTRAYGMYRPEIRGDGPENRIVIEE